MIEELQSQLVTAVAGAVLVAAVVAAAAGERAALADLELQGSLDRAAEALAQVGCSALRPHAQLPLGPLLGGVPQDVRSVLLVGDHLLGRRADGSSSRSLAFPPFLVDGPLELRGAAALTLRFDPVEERCRATPSA